MKKSIIIINTIILCFAFLAPLGALAMEPISEAEMDAVTGQRGVSIAADNQLIYQNVDFWYRDPDGIGDVNGASIGFSGMHAFNYSNAITEEIDPATANDTASLGLKGHYVENYDYSNRGLSIGALLGVEDPPDLINAVSFEARAIFIDVMNQLPNMNEKYGTSTPGLHIAVPTVEIYLTTQTMNLGINTAENPLYADSSQIHSLGALELGPTTIATLDGTIEITPGGDPDL